MKPADDVLVIGLVGAGVFGLFWFLDNRVSNAAASAGAAVGNASSQAWNTATVPSQAVSSLGLASGLAQSVVAAPSNALDTTSMGTIGGTNNGSGGLLDTLKAGPFGGLVGILSGDGNTNIFGPAPSAGLDFGTGADDWSDS